MLERVRRRHAVDQGRFEAKWGALSEHWVQKLLIKHLGAVIPPHGTYIWLVAVDELLGSNDILKLRLMQGSIYRHHMMKRRWLKAGLLRWKRHAHESNPRLALGLGL